MTNMLRPAGLLLLAIVASAPAQTPVEPTLADEIQSRAASALRANPNLERNPYAVLVRFDPRASQGLKSLSRRFAGTTRLRGYDLVPGLELVGTGGRTPEEAVATLRKMPGVLYAEPDYVLRASQNQVFPRNTNFYPYQWSMHNDGQLFNGWQATVGADVNAPEAWYVRTGDPDFIVAVIDSGVQYWRDKIDDNIWTNLGEIPGNGIDDDGNGYVDDVHGWDFSANDNDPDDESGHGTHVAGIIGSEENEGGGVVGMMWQCQIMPLRFLDANGSGFMSNAALAVQYAVQKGAKVSNNSYGYATSSIVQSLYDAIQAAGNAGHLFVAAAGNNAQNIDSKNNKYYPACYNLSNIVSVAATTMRDERASFSNYGKTSVDIGAPGDTILSLYLLDWGGPGYTQRWMSGTSMAAPHVAGTIGLVWSQNPTWTATQVKNHILATARPIAGLANVTVTGGVVDAGAALGNRVPPPPTPPAAPGTPTLVKSGSTVNVFWTDNSNNEAGFEIQREKKLSGNKWGNQSLVGTVGANVTTLSDSPGSGTFRYRVRSYNSAGTSSWTSWAQVTM